MVVGRGYWALFRLEIIEVQMFDADTMMLRVNRLGKDRRMCDISRVEGVVEGFGMKAEAVRCEVCASKFELGRVFLFWCLACMRNVWKRVGNE